jgi:carboxypeptidase family protein
MRTRRLGWVIVIAVAMVWATWQGLGSRSGEHRRGRQPAEVSVGPTESVAAMPTEAKQGVELLAPVVPEPARILGRILLPAGRTLPDGQFDWEDVRVECSRWESDLEDSGWLFLGVEAGAVLLDHLPELGAPSTGAGQTKEVGRPEDQPQADGSYAIAAPPLGVPLQVRVVNPFGPDFVERLEALEPGEQRELPIALERGYSVRGVVVDAHGSPVPGASVWITDVAGGRRGACGVSPSGAFSLENLEPDNWVLTADRDEFLTSDPLVVDTRAGDVEGVILTLVPGGDIELSVFWPDGTPAESIGYSCSSEEVSMLGAGGIETRAGALQLRGLPFASYEFDLWAERENTGGKAHLSGVRPGESVRVTLETYELCELRGRVLDRDGRPVRNCQVNDASMDYADMKADGRFVLRGRHPGTHTIRIRAHGYLDLEKDVELVAGEPREHTFILQRSCVVRGVVLDGKGQAVPLASVWAGKPTGIWGVVGPSSLGTDIPTSLSGTFEFEAKWPVVSLGAYLPGSAPSTLANFDTTGHRKLDVVLRLRSAARLAGSVFEADGRPATAVRVVVRQGLLHWEHLSDLDGRFQFDDLPAGSVHVDARRNRGSSARVQRDAELVAAQSLSIDLHMPVADPVRVHGRITWQDKPIPARLMFMADFSQTISCKTRADGTFEAELFAPGEWSLWIDLDREDDLPPELLDQYVPRIPVSIPDTEPYELPLTLEGRLAPWPAPQAPR